MPRLDRTGPNGKGCMSGRGLGKCNSENVNKVNNKLDSNDDSFSPSYSNMGRRGRGRRNLSCQRRQHRGNF